MAYAQQFAYQTLPDHSQFPDKRRSVAYCHDSREAPAVAVLDPHISEPTMMSPDVPAHYRRDSVTNSAGVLSPPESAHWDHKPYPAGLGIDNDVPFHETNPFRQNPNTAFSRPELVHGAPVYSQLNGPWSFDHPSDTSTPTGYDFTGEFDGAHYSHSAPEHVQSSYTSFTPIQQDPGYGHAPQVQTPMSPQSHPDWMSLAAQEDPQLSMAKRLRSPPRTYADFQKRDGIRKKNARVEIPPERSLDTIERLITQSTNDEELKELKAQKRLLRNREAALASRQRKKKHTEDLEYKEKGYNAQINMLKKQVDELRFQYESLGSEKQALAHQLQQASHDIATLHMEKEELVLKHTEESADLRRKNQWLTEQLEAGPAPAMSANPSSTGISDFTSEMDALNMNGYDWGDLIQINDTQNTFADFNNWQTHPNVIKEPANSTTQPATEPEKPSARSVEPPVASGILFMLLLCGAFVASKSATSTTQTHIIPPMPKDVRDASTTVLDTLLKDAKPETGLAFSQPHHHTLRASAERGPSAPQWELHSPTAPSRLDALHHALTTPTKKQEWDQAFSLTPSQYASLAHPEFPEPLHSPQSSTGPSHRRNLAQTLENMRTESVAKGGEAEVYTRSLLWDQIPLDVVKQFKELVRETKRADEAKSKGQYGADNEHGGFGYKTET